MDNPMMRCPVCKQRTPERAQGGERRTVECPGCGTYSLPGTLVAVLANDGWNSHRSKLSYAIRSRVRDGTQPHLTEGFINSIRESPAPNPLERIDSLLLELNAATTQPGEVHHLTDPRFLAASCAESAAAHHFCCTALVDGGNLRLAPIKVKHTSDSGAVQEIKTNGGTVTPSGYSRISQLRSQAAPGRVAFVAMWFDPSMQEAWANGIEPGVRDAGYEARRVDSAEHNDRIDDRILAMLNTCAFVVADCTGQRGGVYFEAGFGLGRRLPVIWTCRAGDQTNIHFDARQFNFIFWDAADDLRDKLKNRIIGSIGLGPLAQAS